MEKFRKEMMSVGLYCACVSEEYFYYNLREYYNFFTSELCKSEAHGLYEKEFYKLKSLSDIQALGLDTNSYHVLPCFICASEIY